MRDYVKRFLGEDSGIETIEFLGMIVVAVALITVVINIATHIGQNAGDEGAQGAIDKIKTDRIINEIEAGSK